MSLIFNNVILIVFFLGIPWNLRILAAVTAACVFAERKRSKICQCK
jgi:hypothetical protein